MAIPSQIIHNKGLYYQRKVMHHKIKKILYEFDIFINALRDTRLHLTGTCFKICQDYGNSFEK